MNTFVHKKWTEGLKLVSLDPWDEPKNGKKYLHLERYKNIVGKYIKDEGDEQKQHKKGTAPASGEVVGRRDLVSVVGVPVADNVHCRVSLRVVGRGGVWTIERLNRHAFPHAVKKNTYH